MSTRSDLPGPTLVVDLGHTATAAAVVGGGDARLLAEPPAGAPTWPSAVYWDGGQLVVGTPAERRGQLDPTGFGADLTRGLAAGASVALGGREFRAVELVAGLLTALRLEAERVTDGPVRRALLTVPAALGPGDGRRALVVAAAEAAGLGTVELLSAPVAAGWSAAPGPGLLPGDLVLVYDLGGGSFGATLARIGERVTEVLGHDGVEGCGGADVDEALAGRIVARLAYAVADPGAELRLSHAVHGFARRVRHELSDAPAVEDYLLPDAPAYRLDRRELAALAAPVLARTVACCRRLLARLDVPVPRVATILLVGGASRMPAVVDVLAAEFGRPLRRAEEPELAVVRGAVRWLEHSPGRLVPALSGAGRPAPLSFTVPGGAARLLRWTVTPGERYAAGQGLARVRLPGGALWDLSASAAGTLERVLAEPGDDVTTGQWLAVARG
jgi:molecular chaperone DnaK